MSETKSIQASDNPADKKVQEFVAKLKNGKTDDSPLNEFHRSHIAALLSHANDTTLVAEVPSNPISSFLQRKATVGMVTLWIVEGIRKQDGDKFSFPSLNPMCFKKSDARKGANWEELSIKNQKAVVAAYLNWWSKASSSEKVFKSNPLEGTGLHWF